MHTLDMKTKTILVVEDDVDIGDVLMSMLVYETPHRAIHVTTGKQALQATEAQSVDLLILNYHLPDMTGLDVYDQIHERPGQPMIPALLLSANLPRHLLGERQLLALDKPFDLEHVFHLLNILLDS